MDRIIISGKYNICVRLHSVSLQRTAEYEEYSFSRGMRTKTRRSRSRSTNAPNLVTRSSAHVLGGALLAMRALVIICVIIFSIAMHTWLFVF